jgi:predicted RNase H-like nuclease (RuvC/YqgF family)
MDALLYSPDWSTVKLFLEIFFGCIAAISVGYVGTLTKAISAQKEYIGALEQSSKSLKTENRILEHGNSRLSGENEAMHKQLLVIHRRIDGINDTHSREITALKHLVDQQ